MFFFKQIFSVAGSAELASVLLSSSGRVALPVQLAVRQVGDAAGGAARLAVARAARLAPVLG